MPLDFPLLELAIFSAATYHKGQIDKGGKPYVLHPLQVMLRLQDESAEIMAAAVLHDVVEDTVASLDEIKILFGMEVGRLVDALTRREGENYFDYIKRVKLDPGAVKIKLADLEENMRIDRGVDLETEASRKRRERYARAVHMLTPAFREIERGQ